MDNAAIAAEHVTALIARARSNHAKGSFDSAREDSSEAIRLDPQNSEAFEVRADAWVGAKRYENGIDDYDAAIRLKPDVARLFARRAVAFGLMRQFRLAVRDYTNAERSRRCLQESSSLRSCHR
jgi:tetratricopeptide (TPR) repeat protein